MTRSVSGRGPNAAFGWLVGAIGLLSAAIAAPYLLAVTMGALLATIAYPLYRRLERRLGPTPSASAVSLMILLLAAGPLSVFGAMAVTEAREVFRAVSERRASLSPDALIERAARRLPVGGRFLRSQALRRNLETAVETTARRASETVLLSARSIPNALLQFLVALIACFFFLMEGKQFLRWMLDRIPLEEDSRRSFLDSLENGAVSAIYAALAAAGAQSALMLVGFLALGVPGAAMATGATFVLAWIPFIGSAPVWLGAAAYLYSQDAAAKAMAMLALGALTSVVDNLVRPLVLRGRQNIHPLVSLVAVLGGIRLFGLVGALIGPLVASVLLSLLRSLPSPAEHAGRGEPAARERAAP